jgi:hypothetical protein
LVSQIPPFSLDPADGWISSEVLKLPGQRLDPSEADAFLEYVFSLIARRPRALRLREGAGVARYLKTMAWKLEPGPRRHLLDRLADVIWGTLFECAPLPFSEREGVVNFLQKHAETYLATFDIEAAVKWILESPVPSPEAGSANPPRLMSHRLSAFGAGNPQLRDDLSERIYAAYHALRRARIHNARGRIANVLNHKGLTTHAREKAYNRWGSYEVYGRVKEYEAGVHARLKGMLAKRQAEAPLPARQFARLVKQTSDQARRKARSAVDKWVFLFHSSQHQDGAESRLADCQSAE